MIELKERPEIKTKTPPAKRWRNFWRSRVAGVFNGVYLNAGDEYFGEYIYPSKDLAETRALKWMDENRVVLKLSEYLGAVDIS